MRYLISARRVKSKKSSDSPRSTPSNRSGTTQSAAKRRANGRPVVSLTLPIDVLRMLDRMRAKQSRGVYVAGLIITHYWIGPEGA